MSVISLPTTLVLTSGKGSALLKPLNDAVDTISNEAKNKFESFDTQLTTQYTSFGNQVAENATESPQKASEKLQAISDGTAEWTQKINEHAATGNYYAFKFGHLIKALIKHTPNIIKESFVEAFLGGEDLNLLSVQKIYNIAAHEKFGDFLTAMTGVVNKHDKLLEGLSGEDNSGIIQIFKELKNDGKDIKQFLEKVKTNAEKIENDSSSYACATKLMMHVLIGKDEMEKISTNIDTLKNLLEQLKTKIDGILANSGGSGPKVSVEHLTTQLDQIKNKASNITDPCPTT